MIHEDRTRRGFVFSTIGKGFPTVGSAYSTVGICYPPIKTPKLPKEFRSLRSLLGRRGVLRIFAGLGRGHLARRPLGFPFSLA